MHYYSSLYKTPEIGIIGSGFAGMAASAVLAMSGNKVKVYEKNDQIGGRARSFKEDGFLFDMGPSWYWMPDVYESFYNLFGRQTSDFYDLKKLDPGFAVIFGKGEVIDIPSGFEEICELFENIETGASARLKKFISEGEVKYRISMNEMVYKPGNSVKEFLSFKLLLNSFKLQLFKSFSSHARNYFKDPRLLAIIEFPILFLGAMPKDTPALYSLMNFSGLRQGTFYPMGGFAQIAASFRQIAEETGVVFQTSHKVNALEVHSGRISHIHTNGYSSRVDAVIGTADYHHIEDRLIPTKSQSYSKEYWDGRTFAPSCLIFYLGIGKKVGNLRHHNLFFDEDFERHAFEIYKDKKWPTNPLFYICCPSKTDPGVAPDGSENLFVLMPIAIGLDDNEEIREKYYQKLMDRLEKFAGEDIRSHVVFKRSYATNNFIEDYNAYKGNAYGLANTLMQTAIFKPKLRSRKINNLFYAGQLTVPGPGVPPSIISGRIAANELLKFLKK
jgi:phytoene desaturase